MAHATRLLPYNDISAQDEVREFYMRLPAPGVYLLSESSLPRERPGYTADISLCRPSS